MDLSTARALAAERPSEWDELLCQRALVQCLNDQEAARKLLEEHAEEMAQDVARDAEARRDVSVRGLFRDPTGAVQVTGSICLFLAPTTRVMTSSNGGPARLACSRT